MEANNHLVLGTGNEPELHYDTPVTAGFNDLLYKMNVMVRHWADVNYPGQLVLLYEFQGWYVKQDSEEDGTVSVLIDKEHGKECHGVYTILQYDGEGYMNAPTLFVWFSDSSLTDITVDVADSPFFGCVFPGDFPPHSASLALSALRDSKSDDSYFTEGLITYIMGADSETEPVYQFESYTTQDFHTVGVYSMRVESTEDDI